MAAQEPHESAWEGALRDPAYEAVHKTIKAREIKPAQVYPQIRHRAFKSLHNGIEHEQFSLSALLRYAEVLSCRPAVHRALCSARA